MTILRELSLSVVLAVSLAWPAQAADTPLAETPAGVLRGSSEGGLRVFKGVPYAVPPVGAMRWKAPQAMPRWDGVKAAEAYGPACYQPEVKFQSVYTADPMPMSEDCLTLNIWAPANAHNAPVFFWIHGGALWGGASRDPIYDGSQLAKRGIIVVSINYRLGVLGWLAHPELSAETPAHISGNYGLLDQIEALHWVNRNIGAFGGDPANVTIAGESAGGLSVMYLMASPQAGGFFAKAIAQSAYMISTPELRARRFGEMPAEEAGLRLTAAVHASGIAALRDLGPGRITELAAASGFAPFAAVDGKVLPRQLVEVFDRGEQAHVPILAGFNSGEIRSLPVLAPRPPSAAAEYEAAIRARYGDLADAFLKLYPSSDLRESVLATTRDALYGWTAERLVRKQTAIGQASYLYLFDHGYPDEDKAGLHAFHGSELPFVFGTAGRTPPFWPKIPESAVEARLTDAMTGYWASFARSGVPEAPSASAWQAFGSMENYMHFADTPQPALHLMPGMYALQEEVVCRRRAEGGIRWNWNVGLASPPLPAAVNSCR